MHTHRHEDETTAELRSKILDKYDIVHKENCTSFRKSQLEKLAKKLGVKEKNHCYFCEDTTKENLEQHHIIPKRYNGSDKDYNIVTLCRKCHTRLEDLYNDKVLKTIAGQIEDTYTQLEYEREVIRDFSFI